LVTLPCQNFGNCTRHGLWNVCGWGMLPKATLLFDGVHLLLVFWKTRFGGTENVLLPDSKFPRISSDHYPHI
jgi:hypothetical protein